MIISLLFCTKDLTTIDSYTLLSWLLSMWKHIGKSPEYVMVGEPEEKNKDRGNSRLESQL